jgi:L-alanine-DL-glutamate epimerase-like enolase superfamily enzyme
MLEQPCATYREHVALMGKLRHPLVLDEIIEDLEAATRAISDGVADGFGLKLSRVGGITDLWAITQLCAANRIPHTCDDAWGGDLVAAACIQIAATVDPRLLAGVWIAAPYIDGHLDPVNPIEVVRGRLSVPRSPGLGVSPNTKNWPSPTYVSE